MWHIHVAAGHPTLPPPHSCFQVNGCLPVEAPLVSLTLCTFHGGWQCPTEKNNDTEGRVSPKLRVEVVGGLGVVRAETRPNAMHVRPDIL